MIKIKAVVLIDGEHYPPVIKQAIEAIQAAGYDVAGAVFLGGTEKVENLTQLAFDFPVFFSKDHYMKAISEAVESKKPDIVLDLSDEPVLGYEERMAIASLLASKGVDYAGSDFTFKAPRYDSTEGIHTIGVIGTGKRVGKTAVSAHLARFLKQSNKKVVVLAMGRGGPEEPVVLDGETILIDNRFLLELKEAGKHAASDYVEDAMMSRVITVGCRRCGGGFAGIPFISNVKEGFKVASSLNPDIIILEGSGSAIPPVRARSYLTVSSLIEPEIHTTGYLGPYRLLISKLLLLTNCESAEEKRKFEVIEREAKKINPDIEVAGVVFRPKPLESLKGEKVFLATTAHEKYNSYIAGYLEETEGCTVIYSSNSLANRKRLREELEVKKREYTAIALELKAAAVDVALEFALNNEKRAVFFDNIPHVVTSDKKIEEYFAKLLEG